MPFPVNWTCTVLQATIGQSNSVLLSLIRFVTPSCFNHPDPFFSFSKTLSSSTNLRMPRVVSKVPKAFPSSSGLCLGLMNIAVCFASYPWAKKSNFPTDYLLSKNAKGPRWTATGVVSSFSPCQWCLSFVRFCIVSRLFILLGVFDFLQGPGKKRV